MARKPHALPRRSMFDSLPDHADENLYCRRADLSNEASVEQFFVNRLLEDLGYRDNQIATKKSVAELTVSLGGARTVRYKPDYVIKYRHLPRWVLDAKSTEENPADWVPQCSGYSLTLNQSFRDENPVEHFVLTNGLKTYVHNWDRREPVLELDFGDFQAGNPLFERLRGLLAVSNLDRPKASVAPSFAFHKPGQQITKALFASCHRTIWKS